MNRYRYSSNRRSKQALVLTGQKQTLPQVRLAAVGKAKPEIFLSETGAPNHGMRFKWIVSTCIAGVVGVCAIGSVMYTSMNLEDGSGVVTSFKRASLAAIKPFERAKVKNNILRVARRKTDLIQASSRGLSTKHIIHDTVVQKRGEREFITIQPYARIVASLSTEQSQNADDIPAFNPFKLYANTSPLDNSSAADPGLARDVTVKVMELLGGILPNEDGQELAQSEVAQIVAEADEDNVLSSVRPAVFDEGEDLVQGKEEKSQEDALPPNTTVIFKTASPAELLEQHDVKIITIRRGDTLQGIMNLVDAETQQAKAIVDTVSEDSELINLKVGQELRFVLSPSPLESEKQDPIAVSFYQGPEHIATVSRNDNGEYVVHREPVNLTVTTEILNQKHFPQNASVYKSIYHAGLAQDLHADQIMRILRIFAYDVDFKKRVQVGDQVEAFFDISREHEDQDGALGELLYASVNISGDSRQFYRFRTPDGAVDYYDENGSSSKKFLMRKPARGARLTSGFGYRVHPIKRIRRMHNGVDWAAKRGTPILAAGDGVIEMAERRRGFGNYVRIRHANSYKTAYGHMYSIAAGIQPGVKVRQGQVIGAVGSTGFSTGNHLHYEVMVNNRHVNPMEIEVPRGRNLEGRLLAEFQKERIRINDLMRRAPVKTRVAAVQDN